MLTDGQTIVDENITWTVCDLRKNTNKETYTVNGTYKVPISVSQIIVSGCAGGAGGSSAMTGAGGGGGESVMQKEIAVTPGDTLTIEIGAGGAGATYTMFGGAHTHDPATMNGHSGGNTKITASDGTVLLELQGGYSGDSSVQFGSAMIGLAGGDGATEGMTATIASVGSLDTMYVGGRGGDSLFGKGGTGGHAYNGLTNSDNTSWAAGKNGIGYGSGGGGAGWCDDGTQFWVSSAGNGTSGVIIIEK